MDVGDRFPDFVLRDENGEEFDSRMLEGIRHIVYFYPRDNTPGCTKEAVEFTANVPKLMMRNPHSSSARTAGSRRSGATSRSPGTPTRSRSAPYPTPRRPSELAHPSRFINHLNIF